MQRDDISFVGEYDRMLEKYGLDEIGDSDYDLFTTLFSKFEAFKFHDFTYSTSKTSKDPNNKTHLAEYWVTPQGGVIKCVYKMKNGKTPSSCVELKGTGVVPDIRLERKRWEEDIAEEDTVSFSTEYSKGSAPLYITQLKLEDKSFGFITRTVALLESWKEFGTNLIYKEKVRGWLLFDQQEDKVDLSLLDDMGYQEFRVDDIMYDNLTHYRIYEDMLAEKEFVLSKEKEEKYARFYQDWFKNYQKPSDWSSLDVDNGMPFIAYVWRFTNGDDVKRAFALIESLDREETLKLLSYKYPNGQGFAENMMNKLNECAKIYVEKAQDPMSCDKELQGSFANIIKKVGPENIHLDRDGYSYFTTIKKTKFYNSVVKMMVDNGISCYLPSPEKDLSLTELLEMSDFRSEEGQKFVAACYEKSLESNLNKKLLPSIKSGSSLSPERF